jgi:very-short-patch-repair endonuclease
MDINSIISDYTSGMNLENVALKYKIGKLRLKKILIENGVELRKRGGQKDSGKNRLIWDYKTCKEESKKYSSKTEMQKLNGSAYNAALRYGWLDDFFDNIKKPKHYWDDIDKCKEALESCSSRSEFIRKYSSAYCAIIRNGWSDVIGLNSIKYKNKLTTEDFKELVLDRHGDNYDTSNSVYVNSKTLISVVCKKHGEFKALPNSIINGIGCPDCVNEFNSSSKISNIDEFKQKYTQRFGHKLTFDKSVYIANDKPMLVTCPIHGDFYQTPNKLLNGFGCHECAKKKIHDDYTLTQDEFINRMTLLFGDTYDLSLAEYKSIKEPVKIICKEHGVFEKTPDALFHGYGCPLCLNSVSTQQKEIFDFVKSLVGNENVKLCDRTVLNGKEIDILVESKKFGIEYNGNYWHTEESGKDKNYHIEKTNLAEKKGYRLIQIFSDEYEVNRELVFDKIRHFLGCNTGKIKVGARKCVINEIGAKRAKDFLDKFHLQGFAKSSIYYGASYNGEIVAVMTFINHGDCNFELNRFATDINFSLPGVASKMFKYFLTHNDVNSVKSFLDRRWGKVGESMYEKLGFEVDKIEGPDYRYIVNGNRVHKFNFRKKTLNKKFGLPLSMTEREMTKELGIHRIYDCGLVRYVYTKKS